MIRRQPKRTKPVSYFADQFGLSAKTIKRLADRLGWKKITYTDGPNAPIHLFEQTVNEYFQQRQDAK